MISLRLIPVLLSALALSACVSANDPASRNANPTSPALAAMSQSAGTPASRPTVFLAAQYDVEAVRVSVPRSLKVSEANTFKPRADIVWRGEAGGDRYQQVAAIFEEAMGAGTGAMQNGRKVTVDVEVTRFHALTEKTRYTIGGMHEMRFLMTVRDAETGVVLDGPREVVADTKASGGAAAIAEVIRRELSAPASEDMIVARLQTMGAPLNQ
jgi:hypothetical protein